jgi:hypothetical protein
LLLPASLILKKIGSSELVVRCLEIEADVTAIEKQQTMKKRL